MASEIRTVLVDDHEVVRRGIREMLEEEPDISVVAEIPNAEEGLKRIEQLKPDVAVLDIKLPAASGIRLAQWLRERGQTCGILILSAYDDDPYVDAAVHAGVNGYVVKSASRDVIVAAVRDVYEGKQVFEAVHTNLLPPTPLPPHKTEPLTQRESEILQLAARGMTNKAIAYQLSISDRTVQTHLLNIYRKFDVSGRTEMTLHAMSIGLISPEDK
jgi:DNA-binding NarL/FixJ family response regulator